MDDLKNCGGCSKPIDEGDFLEIDQGTFHAECFVCEECKRNLACESFIPVENSVFCEPCYYNKYAPKCKGCMKPIKTNTFLRIEGERYHRDCFFCVRCKKLFETMTYINSPEGMLCESCHTGSLTTCAGCREPIKEKEYRAFDKNWHDKCFRCGSCYKSFNNLSYVPYNNKGYHLECYQKNILKTCKICSRNCNEDYTEVKPGIYVHTTGCLDKHMAESDALKFAADAFSAKWQMRLRSQTANSPSPSAKTEEKKPSERKRISLGAGKIQRTYPYEQLIKLPLPDGVDITKRETYLTDEEFEKYLGMTKEAFYGLRMWRQNDIKKQAHLF